MKPTNALVAAAGAGTVVLAGAALLGAALARRVVLPGRPKHIPVLAVTDTTLTLAASEQTTHPGRFGAWFDDNQGHAVIGEVLHHDETAGTVKRAVTSVTRGDLQTASEVRWTGHVHPDPTGLHPDAREVQIPLEHGIAPAWLIPASETNTDGESGNATWAIHIHGIRTTRVTALRTVPAALQVGCTSLVIAYRGDGEGPSVPKNASTLGETEWRDVDAAIAYAQLHGARRIVLIGWSMGASPALLTTERSTHAAAITALVLVSPVTDWPAAIRAGARRAHLPAPASTLGARFLTSALLNRLAGLPGPLDLTALSWTAPRRLTKPCLVIHSDGDREIPVETSRRFAAANPTLVDLVEIGGAGHAWEYNLDPDRFTSTITSWLQQHLGSYTSPGRSGEHRDAAR